MFLRNLISIFDLPSNVMNTRNLSKWYLLPISSNENLKPGSNIFMNFIGNELINKAHSLSKGGKVR